jgi:signal transduction histidine kinase
MVTESGDLVAAALTGHPVIDDNIEEDRWGSWISAYAPIYGPDGKPEAVLGVDYHSEAFVRDITRARELAIGGLALAESILLTFCLLIAMLRANLADREARSRELDEAAREVGRLNAGLEAKVLARTVELEAANRELEAFAYSVSHDLRTPLRAIEGFANLILTEHGAGLSEEARLHFRRIQRAGRHMAGLIDDLLRLSRVARADLQRERVDVSAIARRVGEDVASRYRGRRVRFAVADGLAADGDSRLIAVLFDNLLDNAWKYTSRREEAHVEVGKADDGSFFVRDDGCGFDMRFVSKLFQPFQRLHDDEEFEGNGIGLATVARIVERHGGTASALGEAGVGAIFSFTLPGPDSTRSSPPGAGE